jgi:protein SCO1/2
MMLKSQNGWLRLALLLISMAILSAGCDRSAYTFKGLSLDPPIAAPDFTLTTHTGQPFHFGEDRQADLTLIYFGYTYCPDICPLTLLDVGDALADISPAERRRVQVLFITTDPDRDTPEVLKRYLNAIDPSFIGLTGDAAVIDGIMKTFQASAEAVTGATEAGYLVSHTTHLYLLTPDGQSPLRYPFGFEPEDLRSDLTYLLQKP